ncbi:MAG: hypothetical protein JEY99_16870 [Spirochaetales bacterium]|nr:hypothetical protein [Spirochaetales bacterium]
MLTIVIPTYWQRKIDEHAMPSDFVFDHPTHLDGPDTLTRTLESLSQVTGEFTVVVITATVSHEIDKEVETRVNEIIKPFKASYPVIQFASSSLFEVRGRMEVLGLDPRDISLDGYSAIRNCQLLVPAILGADIIVAIDDDELVEPDFAKMALEMVGRTFNGKIAHGIAGRYFYEWGGYRVKEPESARKSENLFIRKHALQNDSYDLFDSRHGRVVETSITLGGNMVFSKELFMKVPFDPKVTRGEDIDYLINSRMMGFNWMLDKELKIYHYPPPCKPQHKLQEDVIRFFYERKKLELSTVKEGWQNVLPDELKPYPGEYFTARLDQDALEALENREGLTGLEPFYMSPEETLKVARERAASAGDFFDFAARWKDIISTLTEDKILTNLYREKLGML